MLKFIVFCLICYILFILGSLMLPILIGIGLIILACYGLKFLIDVLAFRPSPSLKKDAPTYLFYRGRNPAVRLVVFLWNGFISLIYHLVFTITRAINDGKNSYKN